MTDRKIAFVTGSSRGIGKGIAIELAKAGYDVGVHYSTTREGAEDTCRQIEELGRQCHIFQGDISSLEDIARMFREFFQVFDHIDLMVNNAGITRGARFLDCTPELFEQVINTDLRGTFFCAQAAARNMVENGVKGTIINIASNHSLGCWPGSSIYAAAKAGMDKMGKNIAMELAREGIRVVTVAPGYTRLPEREALRSKEAEERRRSIMNKIPINRFAEPWEIGRAVVFLASDGAQYITGTTLFIDGGSLLPVVAQNNFS